MRRALRFWTPLDGACVPVRGLVAALIAAAHCTAAPTDRKPSQDHWSLQPVERPHVPEGGHPVDAFVHATLRSRGLTQNPPAPPEILIRRLSFDLVGLPPDPDWVDAFVQDPTEARYLQLVDRLLASPGYGERWGRHWLDIVRYTESQGFEYDRPRDHAWPYRDYVIRSLNADKPYDQFMREQVAGDVLDPVTADGIVAASLLVCGPWDQAGNSQANATQRAITREEELEDLVSVVGQTFLGLTIHCARCHDHKFDPVPLTDYYRVKAVFAGVKHGERPIEGDTDREFARQRAERARAGLAASESPGPVAYVGVREQPALTRVLKRGSVTSPGDPVSPGGLQAVRRPSPDLDLAPDAPEAERRRRFADWLADPANPLPARVMANRIWQHHFGQGLVATPSDFGSAGAAPSHPELLDWLASELIAGGWSLKHLHRLLVTSATYRQSAEHRPEAAAVDADNTLLWRQAPRRLEAEAIRDAMLWAGGSLNRRLGGPSFRPFTTSEYGATFYHLFDRDDPDLNRRTVYRMNIHSGKEPLLDALDCPDPSVKTPRRGVTVTPLQALGLMNSAFVQRQSAALAGRALRAANGDPAAAVAEAWRLALGRAPTERELRQATGAAGERGLERVCWVLLNSTEFVHVR
ncbi:MAG: DUF1553 domain-containing protein [Verrucomicrobiae bacterium]|nr:DUF1553 domain-containing protein [Verrucomicrobiae bacterium]